MLTGYHFGRKRWYDADEVDREIQKLKFERCSIINERDAIKKQLDGIKSKFKSFVDNFCKEVLSVKNLLTNAAQNAQMNFYDEFIAELKEPPEAK